MREEAPGEAVPATIGELDEAYRRGFKDCLAITSEWSSLKGSLDRLSALFERVLHNDLDELRARRDALHDIEGEVEKASAYWRAAQEGD